MGAHDEVRSSFSSMVIAGLMLTVCSSLIVCCVSCVHYDIPSFRRVPLSNALIERAMNATVGFVMQDPDATIEGTFIGPYCTGFFVDETHIVSSAHCFQNVIVLDMGGGARLEVPTIMNPIGQRAFFSLRNEVRWMGEVVGFPREAEVVAVDTINDLAVLRVLEDGFHAPAVLPVTGNVPFVGEYVFHVGHPLSVGWSFFEGIVSNIIAQDLNPTLARIIQTTVPVTPGSSGGPLLNTDGEVVGVVDSYIGHPGNSLGLCHTGELVLRLLATEHE